MTFGLSAAAVGGIAAAAGAVGGAYLSSQGAKDAAQTQADAANNAANLTESQWVQTQKNLMPYLRLGNASISPLFNALGYNATMNQDGAYNYDSIDYNNPLQQRFAAPTAEQAQQTPGYQFTLDQGLKATQNSAAARGLGTSGAALKGAAQYATGLADSTYNDVYNRALQTFNTNYNSAAGNANRLMGLVSNGQNAAATNGSLGAATSSSLGNTLMSGANASAAGTVGSANALSGALGSMGNSAMLYGLMQNNAGKTATPTPTASAGGTPYAGGDVPAYVPYTA